MVHFTQDRTVQIQVAIQYLYNTIQFHTLIYITSSASFPELNDALQC